MLVKLRYPRKIDLNFKMLRKENGEVERKIIKNRCFNFGIFEGNTILTQAAS